MFLLVDMMHGSSGEGGASCDVTPPDPAFLSGLAQHRRDVEADLSTRVAKDAMVFKLGPGDQVCGVGRIGSILIYNIKLRIPLALKHT